MRQKRIRSSPFWWNRDLLFLLAGLCAAAASAQTPPSKPAPTPTDRKVQVASQAAPRPAPVKTVDGGKCVTCHEDQVKNFAAEPHGKSVLSTDGAYAARCETCHGNGDKHAETADPKDIANPAKMPAALVAQTCLTCHSKEHARLLWLGGEHDRKGMSCLSCHSNHHAKSPEKLLVKATESEVCLTCHIDVRKAFFQRSTHLFRTEHLDVKVGCVSCHNPHGGEAPKMLAAISTNETCYTCHADRRGPVLWEHPPVRENCLNCHLPHGSNNLSLLKARTSMLCQECHIHMLWRHQTIGGFDAWSYNRGCANCHNQVHGSNHPSGKAFTR